MQESRFEFMVRFASEDLDNYRPPHWALLRDDLQSFMKPPDDSIQDRGAVASVKKLPIASDEDLRAVRDHLNSFLQGFVEPRPLRNYQGGLILGKSHFHFPLRDLRCTSWETPGRVTVHGPLKDCVLFIAASLLSDPQSLNIVSCPDCKNVFMREGKQIFCSRKCTNRAMVRRKRAKDAINTEMATSLKGATKHAKRQKRQK